MSGDDTNDGTDWKALAQQRGQELAALNAQFDDFSTSSKELEDELMGDLERKTAEAGELERELEQKEARLKRMRAEQQRLQDALDAAMRRASEHARDANARLEGMGREVAAMRATLAQEKSQRVRMEDDNDRLQQSNRSLQAQLDTIQAQRDELLERHAMTVTELEEVKEAQGTTVQRLREQLRDALEDAEVLRARLARQRDADAAGEGAGAGGGPPASPAPMDRKGGTPTSEECWCG